MNCINVLLAVNGILSRKNISHIAHTAVQRWMVMGMASCKDCKHYPMCGFSKYAKVEKCLDFIDTSNDVRVVRCKDCKYGEMCSIREAMAVSDWNAYCYRGERKDND